jgi:hypothetical protein
MDLVMGVPSQRIAISGFKCHACKSHIEGEGDYATNGTDAGYSLQLGILHSQPSERTAHQMLGKLKIWWHCR